MSRQDDVRKMLNSALDRAKRTDAPPAAVAPSGNAPLRIASVTLAVRDLDPVARFYREAIGLDYLEARPDGVVLGAGRTMLLRLVRRPDASPDDPREAGLFHTAFLLPTRSDLGAWLRHVATTGYVLDGAADHLVSEALYLRDPEGNGVEVYADRPRDEWRWDGGQVVMANDDPDFAGILDSAQSVWVGVPSGTSVGHVHLRVGDVSQAVAFYIGLGLDVMRAGPQAAFLSSGRYHHHVACNVWHSRGAGPRDPGRAGLASIEMVGLATSVRDPWGTALEPARAA